MDFSSETWKWISTCSQKPFPDNFLPSLSNHTLSYNFAFSGENRTPPTLNQSASHQHNLVETNETIVIPHNLENVADIHHFVYSISDNDWAISQSIFADAPYVDKSFSAQL